jgi:hypothetical protein
MILENYFLKHEKQDVLWVGVRVGTQRMVEKINNFSIWGGWYTDGGKIR